MNEDGAGNFEIRDDRPASRKAVLVEIDRSSRERKLTLDSKIASLLYIDRFIDASHMIHCTCPARKEGPCVKSIQCQSDTTRGLVLPPTALSILGCLLGITSILGNHPFTHPCMCTADVSSARQRRSGQINQQFIAVSIFQGQCQGGVKAGI